MKKSFQILAFLSAYFLTASNTYAENNCSKLKLESKKKPTNSLKKLTHLESALSPQQNTALNHAFKGNRRGVKVSTAPMNCQK